MMMMRGKVNVVATHCLLQQQVRRKVEVLLENLVDCCFFIPFLFSFIIQNTNSATALLSLAKTSEPVMKGLKSSSCSFLLVLNTFSFISLLLLTP